MAALMYPFQVILFWYRDGSRAIIEKFMGINAYIFHLLSVPLLLATFFKPLKNEYRKGLVIFSILSGIAIKSVILFVSLAILAGVVMVELVIFISYLALPLLPYFLLTL